MTRPRYLDRTRSLTPWGDRLREIQRERLTAKSLLLAGVAVFCWLWCSGCEIPPSPPTPDPKPDPVVVVPVTDGLRVLIVRETADQANLPAEQRTIFTAAPFRRFIADNKATLRIWDDEVDAEHESDTAFRKMLEQPRGGLPWIIVAGGRKSVSQPLPKTLAETEALIQGAK